MAHGMSTDTKAIIGTIVAAAVSLGGLLSVQFAGVNTRIDDVNTRIDDVNTRIDDLRAELIDRIDTVRADLTAEISTVKADLSGEISTVKADLSGEISTVKADLSGEIALLREDVRRMDDRLRAVEIAFGKVDQRLETLERLHLPGPDAGG